MNQKNQDTQLAIAASVAAGMTQAQAAKQLGISQTTVSRYWQKVKRTIPALSDNWRETQANKAIRVVDQALDDCKLDLLKRAGIAQTALRGLGYYSQEAAVKLEAHFHSSGAKQVLALNEELKTESLSGSSGQAGPEGIPDGSVV